MVSPLASRDMYEGVSEGMNPVLPSIDAAVKRSADYMTELDQIAGSSVDADDDGYLVQGRYVGVDADALYDLAERFAEEYMAGEVEQPAWDEAFIPVFLDRDAASVRDRFDYLGFANTTNAKFWQIVEDDDGERVTEAYVNPYRPPFADEDDDPIPWDGAMGQWAGFKKLWEQEIRDSDVSFAEWFADADLDDVDTYWGDIPLKTQRLHTWRDTAETLMDQHDGDEYGPSFATLAADADHELYQTGEGMIDRMARMNGYQDYRTRDGMVVWLDKQVQLAGNMMYLHFLEDDDIDITGQDHLEVFANYRLPQMMHHEDVLTYSDELQTVIDQNEEIESGSQIEWELRMLTVIGGHLIKNTTNDLLPDGDEITIPELDNLMYQAGHNLPRDSGIDDETEEFVRGHPKVVTLDF